MNYSVAEEVPLAWDHIINTFIATVTHDVQFNSGTPIDDLGFSVRHGLLYISYGGGDRVTDAFAAFARQMSANTCSECSLPSTINLFGSPKCDNCY